MVLVSDRMNHFTWSSENTVPWVENEQTWIIIHNQDLCLAVCFVNNVYTWWKWLAAHPSRIGIGSCLGNKIHSLKHDGYGCIGIGDFNTHFFWRGGGST